jgi:hypothetical protein
LEKVGFATGSAAAADSGIATNPPKATAPAATLRQVQLLRFDIP